MTSKFTSVLRNIDTSGLNYRLVDAKGQLVGRLAAQLAVILQGKDKPTFAPHADNGDVVVVVNARHVEFTGRKWENKLYKWHTGFPGGLKERTATQVHAKDPSEILRRAVVGMLPKNTLRKSRDRKLRIYPDAEHPFQEHARLVPWQPPPRALRVKRPLWDLPEGFEPLNPEAYLKRYGHQLSEEKRAHLQRLIQEAGEESE